MATKAQLQARLIEMGVDFTTRATVKDLQALVAAAEAPKAEVVSDLTKVTVTCPTPGLSVPLSPYLVRVRASRKAEGPHQVAKTDRRPLRDDKIVSVRVGAVIDDDGFVTEPGAQKRILFNDSGIGEVEMAAWEAFSKNGAHVSYGIRVNN